MFSIQHLFNNSKNTIELESFLKNNIENISSFFNSDYSKIIKYRWEIEDGIILSSDSISELDFSKYYNSLFILTILDYSERFKLQGSYNILYNIAEINNLKVGHRHKAAHIFLLEINLKSEHLSQFENIVDNLQVAYATEEDNEVNVLVTFCNYISNVIRNTGDVDISIINAVFDKIIKYRNEFSFLAESFIDKILSLNVDDPDNAENQIQLEIEQLLKIKIDIPCSDNLKLLETDTKYSSLLKEIEPSFDSIRDISLQKYNSLSDDEKTILIKNLRRGVKEIDNEALLFAYMTLFGRKHQCKLDYAFQFLPNIPNQFNLVDWACGQGLASMVFFDHIDRNNINCSINQIILLEPSELALKRAA